MKKELGALALGAALATWSVQAKELNSTSDFADFFPQGEVRAEYKEYVAGVINYPGYSSLRRSTKNSILDVRELVLGELERGYEKYSPRPITRENIMEEAQKIWVKFANESRKKILSSTTNEKFIRAQENFIDIYNHWISYMKDPTREEVILLFNSSVELWVLKTTWGIKNNPGNNKNILQYNRLTGGNGHVLSLYNGGIDGHYDEGDQDYIIHSSVLEDFNKKIGTDIEYGAYYKTITEKEQAEGASIEKEKNISDEKMRSAIESGNIHFESHLDLKVDEKEIHRVGKAIYWLMTRMDTTSVMTPFYTKSNYDLLERYFQMYPEKEKELREKRGNLMPKELTNYPK